MTQIIQPIHPTIKEFLLMSIKQSQSQFSPQSQYQPEYNLLQDVDLGSDQNCSSLFNSLASLAQPEPWQQSTQNSTPLSILINYINFTYDKLKSESKLSYSDDNMSMCFNTGLLTKYDQDIYAYSEKLTKKARKYALKAFTTSTDNLMINQFSSLPEMANYFTTPSDFIYDHTKQLLIDYKHIIDDNYERFVGINLTDKMEIECRLKSATDKILKWIKRNYKLAVPQYYTNKKTNESKIQLLLPLYLLSEDKPDLVLVVDKTKYSYIGRTILTMEWAYTNARRISKPNTDWLRID